MKKNNPFQSSIFKGEEEKRAKKLFIQRLRNLGRSDITSNSMSDIRYRGDLPLVGRMIYYKYHAKGDGKLQYWDRAPLTIVLEDQGEYLLSLNLHYLPPKIREVFLIKLIDVINNSKFDKTTKLKVTYGILKGVSKYRYFQPCLKKYIKKNIRSNIMIIRSSQWHTAIHLPVARFKGANEQSVWADSRGVYGK